MSFVPETCRQAAGILTANAQHAPEPALMDLCARCLREIADGCPYYNQCVELCKKFLAQAGELTVLICKDHMKGADHLHDHAFALAECIAVTTRENYFKKTTRQTPPAQAELLHYFECCGHWHPDDGTLVTYYYYTVIPHSTSTTQ